MKDYFTSHYVQKYVLFQMIYFKAAQSFIINPFSEHDD